MSPFEIDWNDPAVTVLSLLLTGHVLADFLFQSNRMVREKARSSRVLGLHALQVFIVQGLVVLPFSWSWRGLVLIVGIALVHFAIDGVKIALDKRVPKQALWWFFGDQAAHVGVILLAWKAWSVPEIAEGAPLVGAAAAVITIIVFNANGGAAIVGLTLKSLTGTDIEFEDDSPKGAGRIIGILERWLILGLVWAGQWGAAGLVLTAKSVARFKKMDEKAFAEIYLVGTMTSLIVAMLSGALLAFLLGG